MLCSGLIPAHPNPFQPILAYSSVSQPIPAYSSLSLPKIAYSSLLQYNPAYVYRQFPTYGPMAPLQICVNFAQKPGGWGPSLEICKKSSHISEDGGGPLRMCKMGLAGEALYYSTIYPNSWRHTHRRCDSMTKSA